MCLIQLELFLDKFVIYIPGSYYIDPSEYLQEHWSHLYKYNELETAFRVPEFHKITFADNLNMIRQEKLRFKPPIISKKFCK